VAEALHRAIVRVRPARTDNDLTDAAKRLGLVTVGEWLVRQTEPETETTSQRVADEAELVAYVLATFHGSRIVEEVAS
jgi:sarcosine oxidase gamma subunit